MHSVDSLVCGRTHGLWGGQSRLASHPPLSRPHRSRIPHSRRPRPPRWQHSATSPPTSRHPRRHPHKTNSAPQGAWIASQKEPLCGDKREADKGSTEHRRWIPIPCWPLLSNATLARTRGVRVAHTIAPGWRQFLSRRSALPQPCTCARVHRPRCAGSGHSRPRQAEACQSVRWARSPEGVAPLWPWGRVRAL